MGAGPLAGLRVLDVSDEVGRFGHLPLELNLERIRILTAA